MLFIINYCDIDIGFCQMPVQLRVLSTPFNHSYSLPFTVIPAKLVMEPELSGWAKLPHKRAETQNSSSEACSGGRHNLRTLSG